MRYPAACLLVLIAAMGVDAAEPRRVRFTLLGGWSPIGVKGTPGYDLGCCAKAYQGQQLDPSLLAGAGFEYRLGAKTAVEVTLSAAPWHARKRDPSDLRFGATRPSAGCPIRSTAIECIHRPLELGLDWMRSGAATRLDGTLRTYYGDLALRREAGGAHTRGLATVGIGRVAYGGDREGFRDDWSLLAGVGLFAHLSPRARLRVDVTDHVVRRHFILMGTAHDVHLRVGLAVH